MKISAAHGRLLLLAPASARVPNGFLGTRVDAERHWHLLSQAQRLRGRIYLEDGAIQTSDLTADGRHCAPGDEDSWHLLTVDDKGEVSGCAHYLEHANATRFSELRVGEAARAQTNEWGQKLRWAVEADLQLARKRDLSYVEVGGWALRADVRGTLAGIQIALSAFALARSLGGCIGITTATVRHCSSSILGRIGGQGLKAGGGELPSYHDPKYKCEMNVLRFDSDLPNPRYEGWIEQIRQQLATAPVICQGRPVAKPNCQAGVVSEHRFQYQPLLRLEGNDGLAPALAR
jgi:hypothetical protein